MEKHIYETKHKEKFKFIWMKYQNIYNLNEKKYSLETHMKSIRNLTYKI